MWRRASRLSATLVLVLLASTCSSQEPPEAAEGPTSQTRSPEIVETGSVDGPMVVSLPARNSNGEDAAIRGIVEFDLVEGCVTLNGGPVAWPPDSQWNEAEQLIEVPGGFTIADGDSIVGSGGFHGRQNLPWFVAIDGINQIETCHESADGVAVFNGGDAGITSLTE